MAVGVGGLLMMGVQPAGATALGWLAPVAVSALLLGAIWLSRRVRPESYFRTRYLVLNLALVLAGVGWSALFMEVLMLPDSANQAAGLLLVLLEVTIGVSLFAADLLPVGVFMLGIMLVAFVHVLKSGLQLSPNLQWLLLACALSLPILSIWSHRLQRRLARAVLEVDAVNDRVRSTHREVAGLRKQLAGRIDRQQKVEQELALAKEAAESLNIAKTEFLATMSHEIRTPLNGIVPILEILRETPLNAEQSEFVTTALNSSHHLLGLINNILDYSKIEVGKLELETIELNVRDLVDAAVSLMKRSAERRGIALTGKIAKNVPLQVRGDPFRLRQVLTNLVGNAIKFTERGSVTLEVNRHASSPKEVMLLFAVRDTGVGMSRETVGRLFQLFSQADASTTRRFGGTGLGLVICKSLVEMMGGRIGVRSEQGRGSVFWFLVPLRKTLHEAPSARRSLQGARVLLAGFDDLEYQRIDSYLHEWEMLSERARNASDALTKLKASAKLGTSWSYDVLLIDAQTLGADVQDLVRDIRKVFELSGLVIVVADGYPSVLQLMKDAGIAEILPRPVQEQELRNRLYRVLDVPTYTSAAPELDQEQHLSLPDAAFSWEDRQRGGAEDEEVIPFPSPSVRQAPAPAPTPAVDDSPLVGRVLVVEDNPVNLSVVKKLLQRFGLSCDAAADGLEAVLAVKTTQYDLIFMDVQMPNMDGYQATRVLRRREQERGLARMPIIAMTANAMAGDREKCLDVGMDDYMAKPVRPADLKNMLRQWLPMQEVLTRDSAFAVAERPMEAETASVLSPSASESAGSLDREVLGELFEVMDADATTLLGEYLAGAPGLLARIDQAFRGGDGKAMMLAAHSLKSSSANVGARRVSELARRLEVMGREGKTADADPCWREIQAAYAAAGAELKTIIERGSL